MSFIETIKQRAKQSIKTIVLPEGNDIRTIEAAKIALEEEYANIILIGKQEEITKTANEHNFDISKAQIINPVDSKNYEEFVQAFYELRKNKGMTIEKARELIKDETYDGKTRVSRWISIRCSSFYSRYFKTSTSNTKNSSRNKTSFGLLLNDSSKL